MAALFYILGGLGILAGIGSAAALWFFSPGDMYGRWAFMLPSLGAAFASLLVLAVGGVLSRLDRIAENTGRR